ncbi:MAG: GAF domain-containing protein [Anaerolineales bacterium]
MLNQIFKQVLNILPAPPVFPEDEDKTRKAMYAHWLGLAFMGAAVAFEAGARIIQNYAGFGVMDLLLFGIAGIGLGSVLLTRRGHVRSASVMLVVLVWLASNGIAAQEYGAKDASFILNFAIALMAGLLLGWGGSLIITLLSITSGFALALLEEAGRIGAAAYGEYPIRSFAMDMAFVLSLNAVIIWLLISGLEKALKRSRTSVEELASANTSLNYTQRELQDRSSALVTANRQLEDRSQKLHAIAEVARVTTAIRDVDHLLPAITSAISEQLGYYHVGLFLLDEEKQYAILRAANTEDGLRLLNRGYRVAVGSISPVGYIAQTGQPRVTHTLDEDLNYLNNLDLPESRSQIVLPLGSGEEIIGVIDIQSREVNTFSVDDLSTLSIMSDQVTIAIKNALLYERSQLALREAGIVSHQTVSQAWDEYQTTLQTRGYRYDGIKSEPLKESKQLGRENDSLSVPVQLRDQTIGRIKLNTVDPTRQWTDDELVMVRATAERVALALESARLLDAAQKRATRESFLSEVTAKLGATFQLDSIVRDTVEELGRTLKNATVSFQLVNPSAPPGSEAEKSNGASMDENIVE